jgi:hypothetical protein
MFVEITSFLLGAMMGAVVMASIAYPRVGRTFARILAVLAMAVGGGLLTWALDALIRGDTLRGIEWQPIAISQPSEALGWSAACLVGGIASLVLSYIGSASPVPRPL